MNFYRIFLVAVSSILLLKFPAVAQSSKIPKAVFIIVDGIPADVIESTSTPNLDAISAVGGYARAYVGGEEGGRSETPTISAVSYNSLLTGTWANKHNVWDNEIVAPNYNYWDIFRIAKNHDPKIQTAIFSTWQDNRTKLLGNGLEEAGGDKLDYFFDGFELDQERFPHDENRIYIRDIDEMVSMEAARHIAERGPDLSWVYLQFTDDIGHEHGDSAELTQAVELADKQVGRVWNAVTSRRDFSQENWMIVVTTDHGRDAETGKEHGGQTARERTTWIVTNNQNLNDNFYATPAIVDILPSIVAHLKLKVPSGIQSNLDGKSFIIAK